jgi:hypothetical protein
MHEEKESLLFLRCSPLEASNFTFLKETTEKQPKRFNMLVNLNTTMSTIHFNNNSDCPNTTASSSPKKTLLNDCMDN